MKQLEDEKRRQKQKDAPAAFALHQFGGKASSSEVNALGALIGGGGAAAQQSKIVGLMEPCGQHLRSVSRTGGRCGQRRSIQRAVDGRVRRRGTARQSDAGAPDVRFVPLAGR